MKRIKITMCFLCVCLLIMGNCTAALAKNNIDESLPEEYISYTSSAKTRVRDKEDSSSVYIYNKTDFSVLVYVKDSSGGNQTYRGQAIVTPGQRLIHNSVYENGFRKCYLSIYTASNGYTGQLKGLWSPDSLGSYPYANP